MQPHTRNDDPLDDPEPWNDSADGSVSVSLISVIALPEFQVRGAGLYAGIVQRYAREMEGGENMPPLIVARIDGQPQLTLLDGFHRLEAAGRIGRRHVRVIIKDLTHKEAKWEAARANLTHGLPLGTQKERKAVFDAYMAAGLYKEGRKVKPLRGIVADLRGLVSHTTVGRWLKKDHRYIYERYHRHGDRPDGGFNVEAHHRRRTREDAEATIRTLEDHFAALRSPNDKAAIYGRLAAFLDTIRPGRSVAPPPAEPDPPRDEF